MMILGLYFSFFNRSLMNSHSFPYLTSMCLAVDVLLFFDPVITVRFKEEKKTFSTFIIFYYSR